MAGKPGCAEKLYIHINIWAVNTALLYPPLLLNGQSSKWQHRKNSTITAPESSRHSNTLSEGLILKVLSAIKKKTR